jgi:hypothetical protein
VQKKLVVLVNEMKKQLVLVRDANVMKKTVDAVTEKMMIAVGEILKAHPAAAHPAPLIGVEALVVLVASVVVILAVVAVLPTGKAG